MHRHMSLLDGHADIPDVLLLNALVGGRLFRFPDETTRPLGLPRDHVTVRRCHHFSRERAGVDCSSSVERGDGILVIEATVCTTDPAGTVAAATQSTVAAVVVPLVGSGIGAREEESPWIRDNPERLPIGALVIRPDARYLHRFGNLIDPSAYKASKKRFPPEEIARLLAAFEAHVLADLAAGTGC